jgi:hypothetical protein
MGGARAGHAGGDIYFLIEGVPIHNFATAKSL